VIVFLVEPQIVGGDTPGPQGKAAAVPDPAARELRVYDTRLLTARVLDRPCPFLGRGAAGGVEINLMADEEEEGGAVFGAAAEETPAGVNLEADELVELIRTGIEEDSWSNTRNRIEMSGDLLIVVQKPAVHEAIARFLATLRARRGVLVTTEVWALGVRNDRVAALIPRPAELGAPLSQDAIDRVHQAIADGSAQLLRQAEVTGFNRQRAHALSVLERPVIAGVEVEVAKSMMTTASITTVTPRAVLVISRLGGKPV